MAAEKVFLKIDGIHGHAKDVKHLGWIEARHLDWRRFATATGVGVTPKRLHDEQKDFWITKDVDHASPLLMKYFQDGRHFDGEVESSFGAKVLHLGFKGALIVNLMHHDSDEGGVGERLEVNCSEVESS